VTPKPAAETIRSPGWIAAAVALVGAAGFMSAQCLAKTVELWVKKPEYSHGFLVPLFSIYLAWRWRAWAPKTLEWPNPWGLAFVVPAALLFVIPQRMNFAVEWLQGLALVLALCGTTLLLGGWKALNWLYPSLAFLMFMFPLPYKVETTLGWELQKIAATASAFVLQTVGYPTYQEGVVLHVKDHDLLVAEACSGLSMLLTFIALSVGMALVVDRRWPDKVLIIVSAIPVAVLSNVIRIALTGVLYNEGGRELGERVFHDFAGWLMMPFALVVLWLELKLLDWVLLEDLGQASREDVIKMTTRNQAHLFMPAMEQQLPPKAPGR
jgi:exosortase